MGGENKIRHVRKDIKVLNKTTNAAEFSDKMAKEKGWESYGDKQYVPHVLRYYTLGRIPSVPAAGDLIFFDWGHDGSIDHVGIVESVNKGTVYTIEGNSGDTVRRCSYQIGNDSIYGYGILTYY